MLRWRVCFLPWSAPFLDAHDLSRLVTLADYRDSKWVIAVYWAARRSLRSQTRLQTYSRACHV